MKSTEPGERILVIVLPNYSLSGLQIHFLQNGDRGLFCKIIMIDA